MSGRPGDSPTLPEGLMYCGFDDTAEVVDLAIAGFGLQKPLTVYYPGSGCDATLTKVEGVQVIHADLYMREEEVKGFRELGAEALKADAHKYKPSERVDIINFLNPSGIFEDEVVRQVKMSVGGLVLTRAWWRTAPEELFEMPELEPIGVILSTPDPETQMLTQTLDTEDPSGYYLFDKELGDASITYVLKKLVEVNDGSNTG